MLTATIKTAVSEHEIAMMQIRMRRAARQSAEQGIPKWKRAFGYLGDTYQPDPQTAPLVKQAYAAVLAGGSSLGDIARCWNAAGLRPHRQAVDRRRRCSCSCASHATPGLRAHNGEIVGKGTWPAAGGRIDLAGSAIRAQRPRTGTGP